MSEPDYCEKNQAESAAVDNVVITATGERLLLRGLLDEISSGVIIAELGLGRKYSRQQGSIMSWRLERQRQNGATGRPLHVAFRVAHHVRKVLFPITAFAAMTAPIPSEIHMGILQTAGSA